jgi:predicted MFS family arabinose efflux permease
MNVLLSSIAAKAARWYGLVASSLVVLGSSVRTFKASDCSEPITDDSDTTTYAFCRRTKLAISLGVVCFVMAAVMTYLVQQKKQLTSFSDMSINTIHILLWCFGVSYITFGTSPGSTIGNLYFSTWISFILSVFSFAVSFREYVASRNAIFDPNRDPDDEAPPPQPEFDI